MLLTTLPADDRPPAHEQGRSLRARAHARGFVESVIKKTEKVLRRIPELAWPWTVGTGLIAYLSLTAIGQWRTARASPDLAYFAEALRDISRGESPFLSYYGLHLLGDHSNFFLWVLGPFARFLPVIPVLLVGQAAAASAGVWPFWLLFRRRFGLSLGITVCLLGAYALHPSLQNANMAGFHLDSFAIPFLAGAIYLATGKRPGVAYWVCIFAALTTREEIGILVLCLGLLFALRQRRLGLVTAVTGLSWWAVQYALVKPAFAGGRELARGRMQQYGGDSLLDLFGAWLHDPATYIRRLVAADTALLALMFLAPLAFLPVLRLRWLVPGVVLQVMFLLSGQGGPRAGDGHYAATLVPFLLIAAGAALHEMSPRPPLSVVARYIISASVLCWLAFAVSSPFRWNDLRTRTGHQEARFAAAGLVPDDAIVSASQRVAPLLADRTEVYSWPLPWEEYPGYRKDPVPVIERRASVEWLVLDTADAEQWLPSMAAALPRIVPAEGFVLLRELDGIHVYRRQVDGLRPAPRPAHP